ncbi:MAG: RagB/SusD family nutrient uptake outer membrane protein, partial [Bacteroidales bacterium]|nr:RagB/SusD family nutrient uptake outer membrane protein [Bacteroidales bacterium]
MKNKNKTALLTFVTLVAGILFFTSCIDDFLTRQPMSLISESNVWGNGGDKKAIMALITNNYDCIPFNCGSEVGPWGDHLSQLCDESMRGYVWGNMYTPTMTSATNEKFSAWNYNRVRDINDFLERILETDIEDQDRYVAEAYFIRAFHYFDFAKRYGGVPIIDHTQAYDPNDFEALKVPRSTEEEVWDFIAQDVDLSVAYFEKCKTEAEPYRVNKYAALALKSRAMLYAATIAKYGTVQLNGLVGVPSARAQQFFELSLAASDEI